MNDTSPQPSDLATLIAQWCSNSGYEITGFEDGAVNVRQEAGARTAAIRRGVGEPGRLEVVASIANEAVRRLATHDAQPLEAVLAEVEESRAGLVLCRRGSNDVVIVTATVFDGGLNRHSFLTALDEVAKTCRSVDRSVENTLFLSSITTGLEAYAASAVPIASEEPEAPPLDALLHEAPAPQPRLCGHCGHAVREIDRFCQSCGEPLDGMQADG